MAARPANVLEHPHVFKAEEYARQVVSGKRAACEWVRLSAKRHMDDVKRARRDKAYSYRFDPDAAEKVCRFVELQYLTKGRWAAKAQRFILEPWQCFITVIPFGWLRKSDGKRRFRRIFLLIPRKNGKSEWAAAVGLYMFLADGEYGSEVYSGATTEKQAWYVFGAARQMALRNPKMMSAFSAEVFASNIHVNGRNAKFEPIIGNPGDGANPHCAIHDEYHEHDTDTQVDTLQTGMGSREQPMQIIVTTAGDNIAGPCYQAQIELQKVLSGVLVNDELFGAIYSIDKGDDWSTDKALIKANPNLGVSTFIEFLKARRQEALDQPRKAGTFKTKYLNVWVQAREAYFPVQRWLDSGDATLRLADFAGRQCWIGLDLASKVDIASLILLFEHTPDDKGRPRLAVFARHYLPEETVEAPENEHYQGWRATMGHNGGPVWTAEDEEGNPSTPLVPVAAPLMSVCEGGMTDYDQIEADILAACSFFRVAAVAYDPHQASQLVTHLMKAEVAVMEFRPTVLNFSDPMKEIEGMMREFRIVHDGDPVLAWMISNVVAREDAKDNVYPRKDAVENKIDGVVAMISAYAAMKLAPEIEESVYESRGIVDLAVQGV
jgi:phage terminase large subunit-like protein